MSIGTILLIVLILILCGVIPGGPVAPATWGPSGIVGVILIVVVILLLMGRL